MPLYHLERKGIAGETIDGWHGMRWMLGEQTYVVAKFRMFPLVSLVSNLHMNEAQNSDKWLFFDIVVEEG
jgi:hypothetical protein